MTDILLSDGIMVFLKGSDFGTPLASRLNALTKKKYVKNVTQWHI